MLNWFKKKPPCQHPVDNRIQWIDLTYEWAKGTRLHRRIKIDRTGCSQCGTIFTSVAQPPGEWYGMEW